MNCYPHYPDNAQVKEVFVQAAGLTRPLPHEGRHALITWHNGYFFSDNPHLPSGPIRQLVQLEQAGQGFYYRPEPWAKRQYPASLVNNQFISLGYLTREQRDRILVLAGTIQFRAHSATNGCRVWLRALLVMMTNEGIIARQIFDHICLEVPLPEYRNE